MTRSRWPCSRVVGLITQEGKQDSPASRYAVLAVQMEGLGLRVVMRHVFLSATSASNPSARRTRSQYIEFEKMKAEFGRIFAVLAKQPGMRNADDPIQRSKHYLGIRYDPGMLSSSVARIAPFAVASLLK
jgi:hypothetical protein